MSPSTRPDPGQPCGDVLSLFAPDVAAWFRGCFGAPTSVQARGWPAIAAGRHTLLCAPTGSGKTLAAFLFALDGLRRVPTDAPGVRVVYVSPLRALGNDVQRNLEVPLRALGGVRAAVRTGDTPPAERRSQLRQPPDILITTPESLFILLGSAPGQAMLATAHTVIVDEIHALAGEKRGAHLALTLERLEALVAAGRAAGQPGADRLAPFEPWSSVRPGPAGAGTALQRIGLSATQRPLAETAGFLGGGRPVTVIDASAPRPLDLRVLAPVEDFARLPGDSVWDSIVPQVLELVRAHRTTLIFAGNRGLAERLAARLNEAAGEPLCQSHHGSTARELRARVEADLKAGRLRAVCATGTLEFGIDVGSVDLVIQVEAPRGVARGLQRIGRAGHRVGATPIGRIVAKHPGDLLEAAVTARAMREGDIEPTRIPSAPLDVLAQQVVAAAAAAPGGQVTEAGLRAVFRRARPYRDLTSAGWEGALRLVSDAALGPVRLDRSDGSLRARPGVAGLVLRSGGTIPDRGLFPAVYEGRRIGELDEEFVYESRVGDSFVLGSATWRIDAIQADRLLVSPGRGGLPHLPFWHGDGLGRPAALGARVGAFLRESEGWLRRPEDEALDWLQRGYDCDAPAARCLLAHLRRQPVLPTDRRVLYERFADPLGEGLCLIHSVFGARVNAPWAIALGAALGVRFVYTDDGILLRVPAERAAGLPGRFAPDALRAHLAAALPRSPLFAALFRENAARALVLPRRGGGRRTPLWLQRLRAGDLLADALRQPDHPLVTETMRQCLEDVFDLPVWERVLGCEAVELRGSVPTPFAQGLLLQFQAAFLYDGDAPGPERSAADLLAGQGAPDETALREVAERAAGRADTPAALADLLRRSGGLTDAEIDARSTVSVHSLASRARREGALWVLAGEEAPGPDRVARWLRTVPLATPAEVARRFGLRDAEAILTALAADGRAVALGDRYASPQVVRAARRRTLARLRAEIAPRDPGEHAAWVDARLHGGLAEVMDRLQGYSLGPAAWEAQVLPRRVPGFRAEDLDRLLASGAFMAVGERPAFLRPETAERLLPPLAPEGPVADVLRARGALFFSDVCRFSGLPAEAAFDELLRLLRAGAVTNDSFAPWRFLARYGAGAGGGRTRRPTADRAPVAMRRPRVAAVRDRLAAGPGRAGTGLGGRWSLVPRATAAVDPGAWVDALLARYGVLARSLWEREAPPTAWPAALGSLRTLETAGRVYRGHFVRGLGGVQYALPEAVDGLRAALPAPWWWLPACDPACLLPGGPARREGAFVVAAGARPALAVAGGRVQALRALDADEGIAAARCLAALPGRRGRLALDWPEGEAFLAAAGFVRHPRGWVIYRPV